MPRSEVMTCNACETRRACVALGRCQLRRRPDFTTPPHKPQFGGWRIRPDPLRPLSRIWAVSYTGVGPRCWRWLTSGDGPPTTNTAYCQECCPDHNYIYEPHEGHRCATCFAEPPANARIMP